MEPPCTAKATTYRKTFRWGVKEAGEPAIVDLQWYLCARCARMSDDIADEGAAEAAGS